MSTIPRVAANMTPWDFKIWQMEANPADEKKERINELKQYSMNKQKTWVAIIQ